MLSTMGWAKRAVCVSRIPWGCNSLYQLTVLQGSVTEIYLASLLHTPHSLSLPEFNGKLDQHIVDAYCVFAESLVLRCIF